MTSGTVMNFLRFGRWTNKCSHVWFVAWLFVLCVSFTEQVNAEGQLDRWFKLPEFSDQTYREKPGCAKWSSAHLIDSMLSQEQARRLRAVDAEPSMTPSGEINPGRANRMRSLFQEFDLVKRSKETLVQIISDCPEVAFLILSGWPNSVANARDSSNNWMKWMRAEDRIASLQRFIEVSEANKAPETLHCTRVGPAHRCFSFDQQSKATWMCLPDPIGNLNCNRIDR